MPRWTRHSKALITTSQLSGSDKHRAFQLLPFIHSHPAPVVLDMDRKRATLCAAEAPGESHTVCCPAPGETDKHRQVGRSQEHFGERTRRAEGWRKGMAGCRAQQGVGRRNRQATVRALGSSAGRGGCGLEPRDDKCALCGGRGRRLTAKTETRKGISSALGKKFPKEVYTVKTRTDRCAELYSQGHSNPGFKHTPRVRSWVRKKTHNFILKNQPGSWPCTTHLPLT